MKEIAVFDAKTRLSELLAGVEQGEQFVITRRGVAVARLISAAPPKRGVASQRQQVMATFAALKADRQGVTLEGQVKDLIADGRD